jgi:hypothetical protein
VLIHVNDFVYMDDLSFYVNSVHSLVYVDNSYQILCGSTVLLEMTDNLSTAVFPTIIFLLPDPYMVSKKYPQIPHILAHVNKDRPNDGYPKLEICTWYLILDSYQYIPVAFVTVHCMIWS